MMEGLNVIIVLWNVTTLKLKLHVRLEKFQFLEKGQNRNFDYKIVILFKNP